LISGIETAHSKRKETIMASDPNNPLPARKILLLGPYGVLGTGVVDAATANPAWRVVTAARRPVPSHRDSTAVRHINVDLLDRERTREVLSKLDTVTDLVFAAYVEKPTMAEKGPLWDSMVARYGLFPTPY